MSLTWIHVNVNVNELIKEDKSHQGKVVLIQKIGPTLGLDLVSTFWKCWSTLVLVMALVSVYVVLKTALRTAADNLWASELQNRSMMFPLRRLRHFRMETHELPQQQQLNWAQRWRSEPKWDICWLTFDLRSKETRSVNRGYILIWNKKKSVCHYMLYQQMEL